MEEDPDVWKNQVTEVNGELPAVISLALTQVKLKIFLYLLCVLWQCVCILACSGGCVNMGIL